MHQGEKVLSGAADGSIHLWDLANFVRERTLCSFGPVFSLMVCGDFVVAGVGQTIEIDEADMNNDISIKVINFATGSVVCSLPDHTDTAWAFALCNKKLASASKDGSVKIWA